MFCREEHPLEMTSQGTHCHRQDPAQSNKKPDLQVQGEQKKKTAKGKRTEKGFPQRKVNKRRRPENKMRTEMNNTAKEKGAQKEGRESNQAKRRNGERKDGRERRQTVRAACLCRQSRAPTQREREGGTQRAQFFIAPHCDHRSIVRNTSAAFFT